MCVVNMFFYSHTLYQCEYSSLFKRIDDYFEKGDGDVSSGYSFLNIHTLSQCEDSSNLNYIDGDVDKGGVISGYG